MELNHRGHRGRTEDVFPELSHAILAAAMKVHTKLGPGLLESVYETCLCHELARAGVAFERQVPMPIRYDQFHLDCGFRVDLLVEKRAIIEVKSVESVAPVHLAQLLTYLRLTGVRLGLLINFNVAHLRNGIRRRVL